MEQPGELTRPEPAVTRPCLECYTTSFAPDLVYADGSTATMADEPMLHHAVLSSQWRSDATCSDSWLGLAGERFFASGNVRTKALMPTGYGYRVRSPSRAGTSSGCTANTSRLTPRTTSWASCSLHPSGTSFRRGCSWRWADPHHPPGPRVTGAASARAPGARTPRCSRGTWPRRRSDPRAGGTPPGRSPRSARPPWPSRRRRHR